MDLTLGTGGLPSASALLRSLVSATVCLATATTHGRRGCCAHNRRLHHGRCLRYGLLLTPAKRIIPDHLS